MKQAKRWLFLKSAAIALAIGITAYIVKYLARALIAHHTSPALYGDYAMALKVLNIVAVIALLGTNVSSNRTLSLFFHKRKNWHVGQFIRWNIHFISKAFIFCIALAAVAVISAMALHHIGFKPIDSHHLAVYILWFAPLLAMSMLFANYLQATSGNRFGSAIAQFSLYGMLLILFASAIFLMDITMNTVPMSWIVFASVLIIFGISFLVTQQYIPGLFKYLVDGLRKKQHHTQWEKSAKILTLNNIMYQIYMALDLFILEAISHNEHTVGYYAVSATIAGFMFLIPSSLFQGINSDINVQIHSKEGKKHLQKRWNQHSWLLCILCSLVSVGIFFLGKVLLSHFGQSYVASYPIVLILTAGYFIASIAKPANGLLAYSGLEKDLLPINVFEIGFLLTVGSLLTYLEGAVGMATSSVVCMLLKSIYTVRKAKQLLRFKAILGVY